MLTTIAKRLALPVAPVLAGACTCALALLAPALAEATTPTAKPTAASAAASTAPPASTPPPSAPISATPTQQPPVVVAAGAVTLRTSSSAMLGQALLFSGSVAARDARRVIAIERFDATRAAWVAVASARVAHGGTFLARWRTNLSGQIEVRASALRTASTRAPARAAQSDSSTTAQITVYQPAISTYFGPGFYGQQTACGQTMTPLLIGVANRTLPCGTLVQIAYGQERLVVPVIDRGPYANGANWDLTAGAAQALDVAETVHVGTLVVGAVPNTPTLGLPPGAAAMEATGGALAG